jgi:hypothetical protein
MSGDPERLLSASNADPLERELLGSVRHVGPPEGAKDIAWKGIATQIAVAAAVGAATGSSAAAGAAKAGAGTLASWTASAKVAVVVAASGLALGGGYAAVQMTQAPPTANVTPRPVVTPPAAPPAPQVVAEEPAAPAPAPVVEDTPSRKPELPRQDLLKAESALLTEARAQLRSGNAAGAQASLDRLQKEFPKGMLSQEREVLAIEVLSARGNAEGAKRRAQAFVKAYPKSPHSAKLSRFLE